MPKRTSAVGVTVYTGFSAEHYPVAESWGFDIEGRLYVRDAAGRPLAMFLKGTWLRIEVGPPITEASVA